MPLNNIKNLPKVKEELKCGSGKKDKWREPRGLFWATTRVCNRENYNWLMTVRVWL